MSNKKVTPAMKRKRSNAARKANMTRRVNQIQRDIDALQVQYNKQSSAGKKSALRKQMNVLVGQQEEIIQVRDNI